MLVKLRTETKSIHLLQSQMGYMVEHVCFPQPLHQTWSTYQPMRHDKTTLEFKTNILKPIHELIFFTCCSRFDRTNCFYFIFFVFQISQKHTTNALRFSWMWKCLRFLLFSSFSVSLQSVILYDFAFQSKHSFGVGSKRCFTSHTMECAIL